MIRAERPEDHDAIGRVIAEAFAGHPHSNQKEPGLVNALRDSRALTLSLVAENSGNIMGHVAFSPVLIGGVSCDWYGLGPVSVQPECQRQGIGHALIDAGLERLREMGANGCVLLGDPDYYGRFNFKPDSQLCFEGIPSEFFLTLPFGQFIPRGSVTYHPAFSMV